MVASVKEETRNAKGVAFDDPVPAGSESSVLEASPVSGRSEPHHFEQEVRLGLAAARTDLEFDTLTVRRMPGGVCIDGVVHSADGHKCDTADLTALVRQIAQCDKVANHVTACAK